MTEKELQAALTTQIEHNLHLAQIVLELTEKIRKATAVIESLIDEIERSRT